MRTVQHTCLHLDCCVGASPGDDVPRQPSVCRGARSHAVLDRFMRARGPFPHRHPVLKIDPPLPIPPACACACASPSFTTTAFTRRTHEAPTVRPLGDFVSSTAQTLVLACHPPQPTSRPAWHSQGLGMKHNVGREMQHGRQRRNPSSARSVSFALLHDIDLANVGGS